MLPSLWTRCQRGIPWVLTDITKLARRFVRNWSVLTLPIGMITRPVFWIDVLCCDKVGWGSIIYGNEKHTFSSIHGRGMWPACSKTAFIRRKFEHFYDSNYSSEIMRAGEVIFWDCLLPIMFPLMPVVVRVLDSTQSEGPRFEGGSDGTVVFVFSQARNSDEVWWRYVSHPHTT